MKTEKFYAKGPGNEGYIKNLEVLGYSPLDGKSGMFQMALYKTTHPDTGEARYLLYGCCFGGPDRGLMLTDVTDPRNPKFLKNLELWDREEYPTSTCPKIQIADDLMIVAMSSGSGPSALTASDLPAGTKFLNGVRIYDLSGDPENPRFLSYWDNGVPCAIGVHRFQYNGGRYVHLSSDAVGFEGMIYRILDIDDPTRPVEIGRWWMPDQFADGYPGRSFDPSAAHCPEFMDKHWLHGPPFVVGDRCYMGYSGGGLVILDVHDLTRPRCLGQLQLMPAFSSELAGARTHTALPLPGRELVVVTNEGERFAFYTPDRITRAQAMNNLHMVDVHDPAHPTLIAEFPYPEVPADFPYPNFNTAALGVQGPFGPHNLHEPMSGKPWLEQRGDRVYCCFFHAGLRVYDVSDPYYIKELAYFIPPVSDTPMFPFPGPRLGTAEDCIVDDRGCIYIDALEDGLYILRMC